MSSVKWTVTAGANELKTGVRSKKRPEKIQCSEIPLNLAKELGSKMENGRIYVDALVLLRSVVKSFGIKSLQNTDVGF